MRPENTSVSLYNHNKIDFSKETLFFGEGKNTQRFDILKYPELDKSNDIQQGFDWKHDEVPLTNDTKDHKTKSTEAQQWVIKRTFQRLIFLDSAQGRGPVSIFGQISTLPELENVINTWQYFEGGKHSRTYTEILRALYDHPDEVFDESFELPELQKTAKSIAKRYDDAYFNVINYIYKTQRNIELTKQEWKDLKESMFICLIEINALEGLRFYTGFAGIWAMNKSEKLYQGCSEDLCLICRDENEHLVLTQTLIHIMKKFPEEGFIEVAKNLNGTIEDRLYEIYQEEMDWIDYLFSQGSYIGMNAEIMKNYFNYLFIRRIRAIGYKADKNRLDRYITKQPLPWIDTYINMDKKEKLPQGEKILNYVTGGVEQDLEEDDLEIINKYI